MLVNQGMGSSANSQTDVSKASHNDNTLFDGSGGTAAHPFPGDHHSTKDTKGPV